MKYFLNKSIFFKTNIILMLMLILIVLINLNKSTKHILMRDIISYKMNKIEKLLSKNRLILFKAFKSSQSPNFFLSELENVFIKKKIKVKASFMIFQNWKLILLEFNLGLKNIDTPQNFQYVGYLNEDNDITYPWLRKKYFITHGLNNNSYQVIWYCISDQDKLLPEKLKHLSIKNISANLVPFACRW